MITRLSIAFAGLLLLLGLVQQSWAFGYSLPNPLIGHLGFINPGGVAPSVSSCGTSPSLDTYATDISGTVTFGSGSPTSCTITFGSAFTTYDHCRVTFQSGIVAGYGYTYSLSAITITATALSGAADYICDGY